MKQKSLFLMCLLAFLPLVANADAVEIDGIYYNLNASNHTAEVTSNPSKYSGDVVIPSTVSHETVDYSVTSISNEAFSSCYSLTSVVIPVGVTSIGQGAFENCPNLSSAPIPAGLTSIGMWAFFDTGLTSLSIPASVTSIGADAFGSCPALASIQVEAGNTIYDSRDNCNAIIEKSSNTLIVGCKNTVIPSGVTSIGEWAFYLCDLAEVTIPSTVTSIRDWAFGGTALTSLTIPASVTNIYSNAFTDCRNLESILVENGNTKYDSRDNCNAIIETASKTLIRGCKNTVIPTSITSIDFRAFGGSDLTSVSIPQNITSIGAWAFGESETLESITVESGNPKYDSRDNCNAIIETASNTLISGCKNTVIPNTVISIGEYAFEGCGLLSVCIPNNITQISNRAFSSNINLTDVYCYAENVPTTDTGAFWNNLIGQITLHVPAGSIEAYKAAEPWSGFNSIVAIADETPAQEYTDDQGVKYTLNEDGNTYSVSGHTDECSGDITILETVNGCSVTSIGGSVFRGCSGLTSITIPKSVTSIGYYFYDHAPHEFFYHLAMGCDNLVSIIVKEGNPNYDSRDNCNAIIEKSTNKLIVGCKNTTIPNSVTSIGLYAFGECSGLTSITIPNGVTSIGEYAFSGCRGLTSIAISSSVSEIYSSSLIGCDNLTTITVDAGNGIFDSRDNCNAIIEKSTNKLIVGCKNTTIPSSVTTIKSKAFWICTGLTSLTIPNSVKTIGDQAFRGCTGLKSITIPNSITTIGQMSFEGCSGLTDVYCYAGTIPTTDATAFEMSNIGNAALHVPVGSVDAYKAATPWKDFKEIVGLTGSVKLSKTKANVEKGKKLTLKATVSPSTLLDKSVTWKSSSTKIAKVSSSGKVTGVGAGTATITCTHVATGAKATCKVTVGYVTLDKAAVSVKKNKTVTLKPTVYPSTLTDKSVTWKSSDTNIATVSSDGKVKGVKAGTATITCTSNATGLSASCKVTVGSVSLDKTTLILQKGKTSTLTATVAPSTLADQSVTWKSSDTGIATVSSSGKVKGVKYGTATITCTSNATGLSTSCEVTVVYVKLRKTTASLEKGKTLTLKATVYPSTLEDRSVTWKSSDTKIATVSSSGKVTGVGYGTATITCTSKATGIKATCKVTVGKVVLSMSDFSIKKSRAITLEATVYPTTLADQSVTWESSDTNIATVSSTGRIKGIKAGTVTITCTSNATGLSASCTVTVLAVSESRSFEGDDDDTTGIGELENAPAEEQPYDVYDLSGRKVAHQVTTLDGLSNGIYIVNGKKVLKK